MIRLQSALASFLSLVLGDDLFVSYSRSDGKAYAQTLAASLPDLRVFIDLFGTEPGKQVPRSVLRRLLRSTVCVLVATPAACESPSVAAEIRLFLATKRPVLPISFEGALEGSQLYGDLSGVPVEPEPLGAQSPSDQVVARILASVEDRSRLRQASRLLKGALAICVVAALLGPTVGYLRYIQDRCRYQTQLVSSLRSYYDEDPKPDTPTALQLDEAYAAKDAACSKQPLPFIRMIGL